MQSRVEVNAHAYGVGFYSYMTAWCLAITDINYCNLLIYKTKSPLVKKAGNNSVTKRQFYRL